MTAFEEMGMLPELGKSVDELEWNLPTDVQAEAIPLILGGGDVLMAAETGSGKTGAFCLPCLQVVWETMKDIQSGKTGSSGKTDHSFKHWALNMYDRSDAMAIASDGLLCQSRDQGGWHGCRGTKGVRGSGKYYYEAIVSDEGLCRVGWSTLHAKLDLGTCHDGFGFGGTGKKSTNKQFDSYGESFGLQDVIGCYLDLDNFQIRFSKNSTLFPIAFNIPKSLSNEDFFPAVVLKNAEMKFNFGTEPFKFPPTDGFIALCEASKENATDSTIHGQSQAVASKPKPNAPMCIVIEPSRELAEQTYNQFEKFKSHLANPKIRNLLVVGGVPAREQIEALRQGIDIVTGTPGRIDEFISSGEMCLSQVRFFVLDEADGLLAQNCLDLIKRMHSKIPKVTPDGKRLQMIVCSATLHNFDVKKMANSLMHFPVWVDLKGQDSVPETVHHVVAMIDPRVDKRWINAKAQVRTDGVHARDQIRPGSDAAETLSEAVKLLKGEYVVRAIREHKMDQALIFCRTKIDCDNMERWLKQVGGNDFSCVCLHGDRPPKERKANLESFKKASVKFLICTDVAARGLDIAGVPYVINVTLPDDKANYTHRIGRVGRAERMGLAISLVSAVPEKVWYHGCPSRGKSCNDTRLTEEGGCSIWYNEPRFLADIEEHLGVTIQQIESDLKVEADEFDGKVVYGQKKKDLGSGYVGHASYLASTVKELAELEKSAQTAYLHLLNKKDWKIR